MERNTATKVFTFDCAHMLSGHEGLCKNLHGHTYKVEITVMREVNSGWYVIADEKDPSEGMVLDFKELKEVCTELFDRFDHAFIINGAALKSADPKYKAEKELAKVALRYGLKTFTFPGRATAENMARYFYCTLVTNKLFQKGVTITRVAVWETPTSVAVFENNDGFNYNVR